MLSNHFSPWLDSRDWPDGKSLWEDIKERDQIAYNVIEHLTEDLPPQKRRLLLNFVKLYLQHNRTVIRRVAR